MAEPAGSLVLRKQFDASVEEVFDAWTSPESLMEFMKPAGNFQRVDVAVDARVGGKYRIDMVGASDVYRHHGEYLTIDRPKKLAFTWISPFTDNRPSVVTIELTPRGAQKCELVLTHTALPETQVQGHTRGWTAMLDALASARARVK